MNILAVGIFKVYNGFGVSGFPTKSIEIRPNIRNLFYNYHVSERTLKPVLVSEQSDSRHVEVLVHCFVIAHEHCTYTVFRVQ